MAQLDLALQKHLSDCHSSSMRILNDILIATPLSTAAPAMLTWVEMPPRAAIIAKPGETNCQPVNVKLQADTIDVPAIMLRLFGFKASKVSAAMQVAQDADFMKFSFFASSRSSTVPAGEHKIFNLK